MANEAKYTKDPYTGAVVFQDADAYKTRKKAIQNQKMAKAKEKDSKKVINSLRNELNDLKALVRDMLDNQ